MSSSSKQLARDTYLARMTEQRISPKTVLILGLLQLLCGALVFMCGVFAILSTAGLYFTGAGVWNGFLFSLAGINGIYMSLRKQDNTCAAITFLVLSTMSAVSTGLLLLIAAIGLAGETTWEPRDYHSHSGYYFTPYSLYVTKRGIDTALIIIAILEFFFAIISAVVSCRGVCNCCQNTEERRVYYFDTPAQSHLLIAPSMQSATAMPGSPQVVVGTKYQVCPNGYLVYHQNALADDIQLNSVHQATSATINFDKSGGQMQDGIANGETFEITLDEKEILIK